MQPEVGLLLVLMVVEAGATVVLLQIPQPPEGEPPGVDWYDTEVVGYPTAPVYYLLLFPILLHLQISYLLLV